MDETLNKVLDAAGAVIRTATPVAPDGYYVPADEYEEFEELILDTPKTPAGYVPILQGDTRDTILNRALAMGLVEGRKEE